MSPGVSKTTLSDILSDTFDWKDMMRGLLIHQIKPKYVLCWTGTESVPTNVYEQRVVLHLVLLYSVENCNSYKLANEETVSHRHSKRALKRASQFQTLRDSIALVRLLLAYFQTQQSNYWTKPKPTTLASENAGGDTRHKTSCAEIPAFNPDPSAQQQRQCTPQGTLYRV